jgi:hypothetical protein
MGTTNSKHTDENVSINKVQPLVHFFPANKKSSK